MPYTCNGITMGLRAWERKSGVPRQLIQYRMKSGMTFEQAVTTPVNRRREVDDRFMDGYTPEPNTGCWLWVRQTNFKGYGRLKDHQKVVHAHRYSYQRFVGQIADGLHVLHKCDMPGCVNPDHLFLGTNADNVADKVAKGRTTKGRYFGRACRRANQA